MARHSFVASFIHVDMKLQILSDLTGNQANVVSSVGKCALVMKAGTYANSAEYQSIWYLATQAWIYCQFKTLPMKSIHPTVSVS